MIRLTHPLHGAKHAYAEAEALADEKNGWVREVKTEQPLAVPAVGADATLITLPPKRGPGRPKKE